MTQAETVPDSSDHLSLVPRLLVGTVMLVCRYPALVLGVSALSVVVCIWAACSRLQYRTQRDELISPDKECQQRWRSYLDEFGDDEDMVVVVRGNPAARARMTAALEALAGKVREQPEHFDRLFYKVDLRHLSDRALLFLPPEKIRQIQQNLKRMKRLLDAGPGPLGPLAWHMFSFQSLLDEATGRLARLEPGKPLPPADEQLLTQLLAIARSANATLHNAGDYRNPWSSMAGDKPASAAPVGPADSTETTPAAELLTRPQYFFSGDGALAFLLVRPAGKKDEYVGHRESVESLRTLVAGVRSSYADLQIGLTGLPVLETDEMLASQSDTNLASWLALAGVALLYLVVFRSLRLPLLTVSTLMVGTVWALGWVTLTVGHLNLLSATFAVMLIGMGDYGVLWVTRYQQERASGADILAALRATAGSVGPGILTAAVTTGLAFYAAMLADFLAVAELGWIAGSGVMLCAFSCFTVLPATIVLLDGWKERRQQASGVTPQVLSFAAYAELTDRRHWLPGLARHPRAVIACGLGLMLVVAGFCFRTRYDHNLLNLQAEGLESVRWERTLIAHTAGASWHALSYRATREEALALKERYEKLPCVDRVVEVAALVPSDQEAKLPLLADIRRRLAKLPPRGKPIASLLPSAPEPLRRGVEKVVGRDPAGKDGGGLLRRLLDTPQEPPKTLLALEEALSGLRDRLAALPADKAPQLLRAFEGRVVADLADDLHRLRDVARPAAIKLDDLPQDLRERYVGKSNKWLLRVFGKGNLWEYQPLSDFVAAVQTVDPAATGKPFTTLEGLRSMKRGFLWAGVYALAAIVFVLVLDFRSPVRVLLALAPLAVGVVLTLGVIGLSGFAFNPANMIALPLVLGVGVDNGVHVLHDYLSRRGRRGPYLLSRSTGMGILVAALTTMVGFGTLMLATHRGLVGLGFILTLGVGCCMLTSLVFLPAVLNLWSRRNPAMGQVSSLPLRKAG